jgi:hypothetical protein
MTPARVARDVAITRLWYCAILSEEQLADGALAVMTQQFADVINAAGAPKGACLFASIAEADPIDPAADGAREATVDGRAVFFSPASISAVVGLIVSSKARPTAPPERCQVELLVGNPQDWDLLPRSTH